MSGPWDDEDKAQNLTIPGMALPGLRDFRVQFVALIEFDLFLGPVVYINEIQSGSSYINKLRNYQTLSEVYAGVARVDINIINTPEDSIAIFRYSKSDTGQTEDADVSTVLLISCIPESDMDPIRIIGSRALSRSRGDPETLGQELSISLREYQTGAEFFERADSDQKIKILTEEQINKGLSFSFIKGFGLIDLEANISDFRYIPRYLEGKDLEPIEVLNFLDRQYQSIKPQLTTSFLFNNTPMIIVRVGTEDIFFLIIVENVNLLQIQQVGEWMKLTSEIINSEWRYASSEEIMTAISIVNQAFTMNSPPDFIENYIQTGIKCNRISPILVNYEYDQINRPDYVDEKMWMTLDELDKSKSIHQLAIEQDIDPFELIRFLEWGKYRHIIEYLSS